MERLDKPPDIDRLLLILHKRKIDVIKEPFNCVAERSVLEKGFIIVVTELVVCMRMSVSDRIILRSVKETCKEPFVDSPVVNNGAEAGDETVL